MSRSTIRRDRGELAALVDSVASLTIIYTSINPSKRATKWYLPEVNQTDLTESQFASMAALNALVAR